MSYRLLSLFLSLSLPLVFLLPSHSYSRNGEVADGFLTKHALAIVAHLNLIFPWLAYHEREREEAMRSRRSFVSAISPSGVI
ncbi:hypothetical protein F5Y10DRAFT_243918 [Nemania abortiva]|nr:hypothetical protein F5Y10DRAFT_243918 [Nemania abortiva]